MPITVTYDWPSQLCTAGDGSRAKPAVTAATKAPAKKYSLGSHAVGLLYLIKGSSTELPYRTLKSAGLQSETVSPSGRKRVLQRTDELRLGLQIDLFWCLYILSVGPDLTPVLQFNAGLII